MRIRKLAITILTLSLLCLPQQVVSAPPSVNATIDTLASPTAGWSLEGNQNKAGLGTWRPAGDVNGDGFADLVVGINSFDTPLTDTGRVLLFYGSLDGLSVSADWSKDGEFASDNYGVSVAGAGDVNGDGYDDVLIGAHAYDYTTTITNTGKAYLYLGSPTGLASSPAWTFTGEQANQYVGYRVAGVGDLNDDGYDDIAIGSIGYDGGQVDEGRVYVFFGSSAGPSATPDWTAESDQASSNFGIAISGIGDVNGDGFADLLVGATLYDHGTTDEGAAFAWYGSAGGLGPSGTPANADWMAESNQTTRFFGETLGTPGDVNDDGYDDVVISSREYNVTPGAVEGALFLWLGSAGGIHGGVNGTPTNADWFASSFYSGFGFGGVTGTRADINGDGYGDVIVGCTLYNSGYGAVFAYFGSETGMGATGDTSNSDWHVIAPTTTEFQWINYGYQAGSAGDVNGDGLDDIVIAANSYRDQGVGTSDAGYHEGKLWAHYSKLGLIMGTITYHGPLTNPLIELSAHPSLNQPPVQLDHRYSGATYQLRGLENGSYYISAYIDLNGSGGPPDPGEPSVLYDQNGDGTPDAVTISSLNRVTGINIVLNGWFAYIPLTMK
jgi:hypothetical protein